MERRIKMFHVVVVQRTSTKCTKKRDACAEQFFSFSRYRCCRRTKIETTGIIERYSEEWGLGT